MTLNVAYEPCLDLFIDCFGILRRFQQFVSYITAFILTPASLNANPVTLSTKEGSHYNEPCLVIWGLNASAYSEDSDERVFPQSLTGVFTV